MNILKLPERRFTIPRNMGIAVNLSRRYRNVFAILEDKETKVENGDLFIDLEGLGEDEARKIIGLWIDCLGFKHVEKAAMAGVAGDSLIRLTASVIKERYPSKLCAYVGVLPSRDETPYKIYTALRNLPLETEYGVTVMIDYDKLWDEMVLIDSGKRKTPRQVVTDLLSTTLSTILNRDVYEKIKKFQVNLFIPAIMYSVSDEIFDSVKGMLRIAEYAILTDYRKDDVEYVILYIDGTGFEKNEDEAYREFQEWTLSFKKLVDSDIIYGHENKKMTALFLGIRRLNSETYSYLVEKCLSLKKMVKDLTPAIDTLKSLGLM